MSITMTRRQLRELLNAHPTLKEVLVDLLEIWDESVPVVVTCVGRTPAEDAALHGSGVHVGAPYRALDLRTTVLGPDYQKKADLLSDRMHKLWEYDPARPSKRVFFTEPHGTGPHGHLQVHERTQRRLVRPSPPPG